MRTTDHTPHTIIALGFAAALLASCTTSPAHAGDPRPMVHGPRETFIHITSPKPTPTAKASTRTPTHGLAPLTFDSPALPPSTYLHPAYPEARSYAAPHGSTRTVGTVHTPHGSVHFDSTTKH